MNNSYTDEQRVDIAKQEYTPYKESDPVKIGKDRNKIGHVSQVHNKPTGEQSFVITDSYVPTTAPIAERSQVQELTVLYRGSTAPSVGNVLDKNHKEHNDLPPIFLKVCNPKKKIHR